MNALELLKNDHQKVSGILDKLGQTTERALKTRDDLFIRLKEELELHAQVEERIFYPAVESESKTRAETLEAYEQHDVVKRLLDEMSELPVDSERWTAKLRVLIDSVEGHIKMEESEIFAGAAEVLTEEQLDDLGARMEAEKQRRQNEGPAESARFAAARGRRAEFGEAEVRVESRGRGARGRQGSRPVFAAQLPCPPIVRGFIRRICG
ncbi:MAG TPA: hemerythrin domain-containing protein [Pyrinomonadaceae bacterium]|jgi:hypothetical protein